jgi:hypothetical protein
MQIWLSIIARVAAVGKTLLAQQRRAPTEKSVINMI